MISVLIMFVNVACANPDTGEARACGYWGDLSQTDRNEAIAWEAVRAYTAASGGLSKNFTRVVIEHASEEAASLPTYSYDYSEWFTVVDSNEVLAGHILQIETPFKRTAVIVDVGSDGWVDVIGSHDNNATRSGRMSINLLELPATFTIYEIGTGMCSD